MWVVHCWGTVHQIISCLALFFLVQSFETCCTTLHFLQNIRDSLTTKFCPACILVNLNTSLSCKGWTPILDRVTITISIKDAGSGVMVDCGVSFGLLVATVSSSTQQSSEKGSVSQYGVLPSVMCRLVSVWCVCVCGSGHCAVIRPLVHVVVVLGGEVGLKIYKQDIFNWAKIKDSESVKRLTGLFEM